MPTTFNQATLNGNTSASDNASFNLSNNAVQNGSLTLSDNAKANVSHSALNGNVSLADKAVFHFETAALPENQRRQGYGITLKRQRMDAAVGTELVLKP